MTPTGRSGYSNPRLQNMRGSLSDLVDRYLEGAIPPNVDLIAWRVERLVDEGIAEVRRVEPPEKQAAMIRGFEACLGVRTEEDMNALLSAHRERDRLKLEAYWDDPTEEKLAAYWQGRYETTQVEFVACRLQVWFL